MEIIKNIADLRSFIEKAKAEGLTIGFVPTMGYLHEGHMSLIRRAKSQTDVVIASIFVNPSQFNDPKDFQKYPRNEAKDILMLEEVKCSAVFIPTVEEMNQVAYPEKLDLGQLDKIMEGLNRPGHFDGVAEIVYKLLTVVSPDKALFGEKDFQQLKVVEHLVNHFKLNVEIVGCPIIREKSGLAMSSRNARLSKAQRILAQELIWALKAYNYGKITLEEGIGILEAKEIEVEYFEEHDEDLVLGNSGVQRVFIAAKIGNIRLIDNMVLD